MTNSVSKLKAGVTALGLAAAFVTMNPARGAAGDNPYIGETMLVGFNFCPRNWAEANGAILPIANYQALFSLLGTTYGGDGRTTFGLPDLRGRVPIHAGTGPGLSPRRLGSKGGSENETLTVNQLPSHRHEVLASNDVGNLGTPQNAFPAKSRDTGDGVTPVDTPYAGSQDANMNTGMVENAGGGQHHTNLMPTLCVNFIIALFGIYPSRH